MTDSGFRLVGEGSKTVPRIGRNQHVFVISAISPDC